MTPKEKSKSLFDNFRKQVSINLKDNSLICKVLNDDMAKQCALIAVDEIINTIEVGFEDFKSLSKINYWQQVKTEIEKL